MKALIYSGMLFAGIALAGTAQDAVLQAVAGGSSFDAANGKAMFLATQTGGKPDTPSCTTCHTNDIKSQGRTRTDKVIEPLALSKSPDRFSDVEKVEKWFTRNCNSVFGRECTKEEKGDFLAFFMSE